MINIAIIDESVTHSLRLKELIERYAHNSGRITDVICFTDVVNFFECYGGNYDIIFTDIKFSYADGFAVAGRIRQLDSCVTIVFLSADLLRAAEGYAVNASGFLRKPVSYEALHALMERVMPGIERAASLKRFAIKTAAGIRCVGHGDIIYVEVRGHKLTFHTVDGQFDAWGSLMNIEQELPAEYFFRISNCFVVNMQYVTKAEGDTVKAGRDELKISRRKKNEFMQAMENYLKGRLHLLNGR